MSGLNKAEIKEIVEYAGAEFCGIQYGEDKSPVFVLFNHPVSKTTMAIKWEEFCYTKVKERL